MQCKSRTSSSRDSSKWRLCGSTSANEAWQTFTQYQIPCLRRPLVIRTDPAREYDATFSLSRSLVPHTGGQVRYSGSGDSVYQEYRRCTFIHSCSPLTKCSTGPHQHTTRWSTVHVSALIRLRWEATGQRTDGVCGVTGERGSGMNESRNCHATSTTRSTRLRRESSGQTSKAGSGETDGWTSSRWET